MSTSYSSVNYDGDIPADLSQPFQMICHPNTDLWEKPPATHSFNSPIIYQSTTKKQFKGAQITVSAQWKHQYDQGGLAIILNRTDGTRQWVKSGIEFYNSEPNLSTVAKDRWADWSLRPTEGASKLATIEFEVIKDGALWVWFVDGNGKKQPLREVAWWGDVAADTKLWVGPYAAKPAKVDEDLTVEFDGFTVATI